MNIASPLTIGPPSAIALNAAAAEKPAENAQLREAAQAFEAVFLRQFLASARASDFGGSDIFSAGGGQGLDQFEAMQDEHLADIASRTGSFGLADAIERQLSAHHTVSGRPAASTGLLAADTT
ncbi:hypothetical protein HME9302_00334 [Alteripontixanthobacter maritimus]|uniref:Flagellar protein FlgJ N-terminal domain-containing protein n=1 Tax=Alteripontixanthobacter maritimus TaxID=2161824 RepID=A0A369Q8A3_9SPHN|nr:rod-binding protein [Alteripontixanthobacter maritimus]RDC59149.1 hypothetical protein HME9302_00334 [Alteripontixanthobacter maritimus]